MERCQTCNGTRILMLSAKCADGYGGIMLVNKPTKDYDSEGCGLPEVGNVMGGETVEFKLCMSCGHIQGKWPISTPEELLSAPVAEEHDKPDKLPIVEDDGSCSYPDGKWTDPNLGPKRDAEVDAVRRKHERRARIAAGICDIKSTHPADTSTI